MSKFRRVSLRSSIILLVLAVLAGCSESDTQQPSEPYSDAADDSFLEHATKHTDPLYVCPMHPQIVRDEPGDCPICGMNLVEQAAPNSMSGDSLPTIASASMPQPSESVAEAKMDTPAEHAAKHADPKYICPMHPQIIKDEPGSCPICGMDLVLQAVEKAGKQERPAVTINNAVIQTMGVKTTPAVITRLNTQIRTVGLISYDESKVTHMHPRAAGWMEKLYFRNEGDPVKKGQVLGEIYSPDILSAQVNYLIALDQASNIREEKARNGLRLLGVSDSTIRKIERSKQTLNTVPVFSPSDGVMLQLGAREGMYVQPQVEIFTIVDLSTIWVLVDVFESQVDWLRIGAPATIEVPAYPGRSWTGSVEYIYPELDPNSRTLRVRLAFENPDNLLKANMFAEVLIEGISRERALVVPSQALIETGARTSVVTAIGSGQFRPVDVVTGIRSEGHVEILRGLEAGDDVVVSGQFLIDSESSLQASFMRMVEKE